MPAIDLLALRRRHLREHEGRAEAVGVPTFSRDLDAEIRVFLFDIAVISQDVQAAAGAMALVNRPNER